MRPGQLAELHALSTYARQKLLDVRQYEVAAKKGVGMAKTRQREKGDVRHDLDALLVLRIDRIILTGKQQARHDHFRRDLGEAWALNPFGSASYHRLHIVSATGSAKRHSAPIIGSPASGPSKAGYTRSAGYMRGIAGGNTVPSLVVRERRRVASTSTALVYSLAAPRAHALAVRVNNAGRPMIFGSVPV